ncbi:G1/S-specific cyclin-E [Hyalella azteca]|uniref:G1/S-specific cyclin-E n=1 Tax=Hyalella azteca TaxID=294128 RepID=A0A8B7MYR7_HYAAZ|nr:G1/S-specific cyclin-E [Hyalella azteca]
MSASNRRSKTSLLADKCGQTDHFSSKRKESEGGESLFGSNVAVVFTGCSEADASEPCAKLPRLSPNIKGSCGQSERRASLRNRSAISSAIVNRRKSSRLSRNIKEDPCRIMASGNGAAASGFKDDQSIARVHKKETDRRQSLQPQSLRSDGTVKHSQRRMSHHFPPTPDPFSASLIARHSGSQPLDDVTAALLNENRSHAQQNLQASAYSSSSVTLVPSSSSSSLSVDFPSVYQNEVTVITSHIQDKSPFLANQAASSHLVNQGERSSQLSQPLEYCRSNSYGKHISSVNSIESCSSSGRASSSYETCSAAYSTEYSDYLSSTALNSSSSTASCNTDSVGREYTNVQPKDELKVRSSCEEVMEVPRSVTPDAPLESKSNDVYTPRVRVNRASPLPPLTWADRHLVWKYMCDKERDYKRTAAVLDAHPALQSRMRAILLDWLSEVSEVYKLHRETYYIAVDYIDRYLQATCNVPKQQLQLLGVTCLFIAAKMEEIYPPKLSEFAYVTDGACRDEEIIEKELVVVKTLSWKLSPLTCTGWLKMYMQVLHEGRSNGRTLDGPETEFVYQCFHGENFVQICRLLDLCTLEVSSLKFPPSLLSAGALSFFCDVHRTSKLTMYSVLDLLVVQRWMQPFAETIAKMKHPAQLKSFKNVAPDDYHNIQTKSVGLEELEAALVNLQAAEPVTYEESTSPVHEAAPVSVLTPPKTEEKKDEISEGSSHSKQTCGMLTTVPYFRQSDDYAGAEKQIIVLNQNSH